MAAKSGAKRNQPARRWPTALAGALIFLLIWQWVASFYPAFILPSPGEVWTRFQEMAGGENSLFKHILTTCAEALGGFLLATACALPLCCLLARNPFLDRLITPYVVAIQAVPIVAVAPLLVIWFGFGIASKLFIAGLVAFFPVLTNGVIGLKEVDPKLKEVLTIMGATRRQIFWKLEIPAALPVLFGGFKLGMTLSVIGAVVGEFSGAGQGLGYLVNFAKGTFDTPLIFVALFFLAAIGIGFYSGISLLEYLTMPWKRRQ